MVADIGGDQQGRPPDHDGRLVVDLEGLPPVEHDRDLETPAHRPDDALAFGTGNVPADSDSCCENSGNPTKDSGSGSGWSEVTQAA